MFYLQHAYNKVSNFIYGENESVKKNKHYQNPKKKPANGYLVYVKSASKLGLFMVTLGTMAYLAASKGVKFSNKEDDRLSKNNFNSFSSNDEANVFLEPNSYLPKNSENFENSYPQIAKALLGFDDDASDIDEDEYFDDTTEDFGNERRTSNDQKTLAKIGQQHSIFVNTAKSASSLATGRKLLSVSNTEEANLNYCTPFTFELPSTDNFHPRMTSHTFLTNGKLVITFFEENGYDGDASGVYAQLYTPNFEKAGNFFQVNTYTIGNQHYPAVSYLPNGGFVVTWNGYGQVGEGSEVFAQCFDSEGNKVGAEFLVNTYLNNPQSFPAITTLKNGNFVIVWRSYLQDGIIGRMFNESCHAISAEFPINTVNEYNQNNHIIAASEHGDFLVAWNDDGKDGSSDGIFAQRFNITGIKNGPEFLVNTYVEYAQLYHKIAWLKGGGFVLVWEQSQTLGIKNICGKVYNSIGEIIKDEFTIYNETSGDLVNLIGLDDGGFFVQGIDSQKVIGKRFDAFGNPIGKQKILINALNWASVIFMNNSNSNLFITWYDGRGSHSGVINLDDICIINVVDGTIPSYVPIYNTIAMIGIISAIACGVMIPTALITIATAGICVTSAYCCKKAKAKKLKAMRRMENIELVEKDCLSIETLAKHIKKSWLIPFEDITVKEKLAKGGGGIVYRAIWEKSDVVYKICKLDSEEEVIMFSREIKLMINNKHPNIVQAFGICLEARRTGIVMEYMPMGSLQNILHNDKLKLTWETRYVISCDIVIGLAYLHKHGVMHRDLKSANVLVYEYANKLRAKITDFGLAKKQEYHEQTATARYIGTFPWMAPDLITQEKPVYKKDCDMYSIGVIFWELATRKKPFSEIKNQMQIPIKVATKKISLKIPDACPISYAKMIKKCCRLNAEERPTADELIKELQQEENRKEITTYQDEAIAKEKQQLGEDKTDYKQASVHTAYHS